MKYISFTIKNYKGIDGPLVLNIDKNPLIPIIGVNECGKTTILQAIFGFDFVNDALNKNVRHLNDIKNRYKSPAQEPEVGAEIEITRDEISSVCENLATLSEEYKSNIDSWKRKLAKDYSGKLILTRNLVSKIYSLEPATKDVALDDLISKEIIKSLPYTLFFDDFRDSIENKVEIIKNANGETEGWLAIIEKLFRATSPEYDILELPSKEERERKGILSNVNRTLEKVLTKEWKNFRLEDRDEALKIQIDYEKESTPSGEERHYVKFDVVEKNADGQEYFFYIQDRSKGFFWFFNFVMKLEFNPKVIEGNDIGAIYLLDEPGSYLHANAQVKLCNKLRSLSQQNKIIYCTHSHYLLNPEVIPINSIRVAVKDPSTFQVNLKSIHEFEGLITDKKSAFQPIIDALQVKPFGLHLGAQKTILVEGIYDYYCFEMFKENNTYAFIPGTNADSLKYHISLMIAWGVDYRVIWDGDAEGKSHYAACSNFFGDQEAKRFRILGEGKILQDFFEGDDLIQIRKELGITGPSSFEKTILTLFYSESGLRTKILSQISKKTKERFSSLISEIDKQQI